MSATARTERYNAVAIALHWLIAAAIVLNLCTGYWIAQVTGRDPKLATPFVRMVLDTHMLVGLGVLGLGLVRLGWRLANRPPALPAMHAFLGFSARLTHVFFYVAMIAIPTAGALFVGVARRYIPASIFPDISYPTDRIPHFAPTAPHDFRELLALFLDTHTWLAWSTAALLVIHVGAALLHHIWYRDDVLTRMLPRFLSRRGTSGRT